MPAPAPRPLPLALIGLLLAASTLSGCTGSDPEPTSSSGRSASTSASAETSESATPSASSEPTEPTEDPTAETEGPSAAATTTAPPTETAAPTPTAAPASLRSRLLPAGEVPGFNQEFRWRTGATQDAEPAQSFGTCQRFALSSIGAESVAVRGFRPVEPSAKRDTAGELVAQFPDATTARRAYAVLTSWRAKCADRLKKFDRVDVGDLENVSAPGAKAGWYLLTYGPAAGDPDELWFDAQGMAIKGDRIAMVEMILAGQDYNYDVGQEPMVAAVQRAAALL